MKIASFVRCVVFNYFYASISSLFHRQHVRHNEGAWLEFFLSLFFSSGFKEKVVERRAGSYYFCEESIFAINIAPVLLCKLSTAGTEYARVWSVVASKQRRTGLDAVLSAVSRFDL